ncbi:hypothetical protein TBK1r_46110 [Stieleria magnilauensis]|uniref:Uncharacterized protein n=1 Tax=Stieleria magnilauensis TaxID=2527963 RepID=A0ABX5XWB7_9BACT|nr:hypothetical protein TBK1r_46110 [Planctomycetes bacterium TBK1r]
MISRLARAYGPKLKETTLHWAALLDRHQLTRASAMIKSTARQVFRCGGEFVDDVKRLDGACYNTDSATIRSRYGKHVSTYHSAVPRSL